MQAYFFFIIILFCAACTYNNEQDLYPSSSACQTDSLSYSKDIIPILSNNGCISCHSNQASLDLEGYADVKTSVDNGSLLGSIKHESPYRSMPDAQPKIDQCSIDKIESWINSGAPNN